MNTATAVLIGVVIGLAIGLAVLGVVTFLVNRSEVPRS